MTNPIDCKIVTCLDEEILVSPRNWGRGEMYNAKTGRYCLLGGLNTAVRKVLVNDSFGAAASSRRLEIALSRILMADNSRSLAAFRPSMSLGTSPRTRVISFNDDQQTRFKDVKAAIKTLRAEVCGATE